MDFTKNLSKDDVLKIMELVEASSYDEVRLEVGDFKLHMQKHDPASASTLSPPPATVAPAHPPTAVATLRSAPDVRVDSHCYRGYFIPPFYDSMVAKLIVRGEIGRASCRERVSSEV